MALPESDPVGLYRVPVAATNFIIALLPEACSMEAYPSDSGAARPNEKCPYEDGTRTREPLESLECA